jgi:phage terminase large subunit-like protein
VTSLADLDPEQVAALLAEATDEEARLIALGLEAEVFDWTNEARPSQLPPDGEWLVWLILAGRGFGKTRTGAEWVKSQALPDTRGALVGATLDDVRDTMVEGESGLLSVLPPSSLRGGTIDTAWNRTLVEVYLANGAKLKGFSSQKPDKLRGPQHHYAWGDEPMAWADADKGPEKESTTWSNLMLGLRLGSDPRCVVTGTPKPRRLLVGANDEPGLLEMPGVVITRGTTYDNLSNLAPTFAAQVIARYEGTRTGRQELNAEVLEDVEGALWSLGQTAAMRVRESPDLARVTVAIDPAGGGGSGNDEVGLVVMGRGFDGHGYVLADLSDRMGAAVWGRRAVEAAMDFGAQRIVGETNYGGDMVVENVRVAIDRLAQEGRPQAMTLHVDKVTASRGKRQRAEPVAALSGEPDNPDSWAATTVHLVGPPGEFARLEDELTRWVPDESTLSPGRLDAFVWAAHDLFGSLLGGGVPRVGVTAAKRRHGSLTG